MFKKKNSIEQQQVKAVNPMIILIVFLLIAAIATYIIPAGSFDRIADETTGYETAITAWSRTPSSPLTCSNRSTRVFPVLQALFSSS